jgi:hypothetical protein
VRKNEGTPLAGLTNDNRINSLNFYGVCGNNMVAASSKFETTNKPLFVSFSSKLTPAQHSTAQLFLFFLEIVQPYYTPQTFHS